MNTPLGLLIESRLSGHGWNLIALTPHHLKGICDREKIKLVRRPLDVSGLYVPPKSNGDPPQVIINTALQGLSRSFAAYCKLAAHFTPDRAQARALGAVALCPTWLMDAFSRRCLRQMGFCEDFLKIRYQVREAYPDIPSRVPNNLDLDYPDVMAGLHAWNDAECSGPD